MSYSLPQVVAAFFKRLLPAVLEDTETNSDFFGGWFKKHKISEPSVEDFMEAVSAMKLVVAWKVPPKNLGRTVSQRDVRTEFDRPELNKPPQPSVYDMQREKEEKAHVNIAMAEIEKLISTHSGRTHARTNTERGLLRAERDHLIAAKADSKGSLTSENAKAIREAVEKKVREMQPSALGS